MYKNILLSSSVLSLIGLALFSFSAKAMNVDDIKVNVPYKLENKWHRDQGKPSSLDADSDHRGGRIYRSNSHNDNTFWYLTPQSNGSFKLENKWHRDQGKPSSLDADSDHRDGRIYRSNFTNDNTFWYLTPQK